MRTKGANWRQVKHEIPREIPGAISHIEIRDSAHAGPLLKPMTASITIKKHEAVPDTGSYEVRFADGRTY